MLETVLIDISSIEPNEKQSRTTFDSDKLQELANSIKEQGLLQPILVREKIQGKYEIIAGERRYRACKLVGLTKIPAIIKKSDETGSMIESFLENAQREDLSPAEKENALIGLWRTGKFGAPKDLDKALGYGTGYCGGIIEARDFREKYAVPQAITTSTIVSTRGLPESVRQRVLLKVLKDEGKFGQVRTVREIKAIVDMAPSQITERLLGNEIGIEEARTAVDMYQRAITNDNLKPLAAAVASGEVDTRSAEKTLQLYRTIEDSGISLDPEIVNNDIEEVKRQSALDAAHLKIMEQARLAVLTGKKQNIEFRVSDPGDRFVREVSEVALRVQRWGVPNLMEAGAERWRMATKYLIEIDLKMHSLLGVGSDEKRKS